MSNDSKMDPSRVPPGKQLIKFLVVSVPYKVRINGEQQNISDNISSDEIKDKCADQIIDTITDDYISNLKGIISKKAVLSPKDYAIKQSNLVNGTLSCGSVLPYQSKSMRPIPQLSIYKIPSIPNVYLCASGSHPGPGVSMAPDRNASQIILEDIGVNFKKLVAN